MGKRKHKFIIGHQEVVVTTRLANILKRIGINSLELLLKLDEAWMVGHVKDFGLGCKRELREIQRHIISNYIEASNEGRHKSGGDKMTKGKTVKMWLVRKNRYSKVSYAIQETKYSLPIYWMCDERFEILFPMLKLKPGGIRRVQVTLKSL